MLCAVITCCELAGCAPASRAEGHKTRTWVLPTGHEPFVSRAQLQENPLPWTRSTHKSETQTVLFSTWGQVLISREGQRDLEHMVFVIYFVFLGPISYIDLALTAKNKGV